MMIAHQRRVRDDALYKSTCTLVCFALDLVTVWLLQRNCSDPHTSSTHLLVQQLAAVSAGRRMHCSILIGQQLLVTSLAL